MPSQGVFSNTSPADGEIRVLIQTDNGSGFVNIRSVTISDTDLGGNVIIPSLSEINKILLPISSSGINTTLNITDITDKEGYFFLNSEDTIIGDSQNSISSSIAVDPFLIEPFFNNQYNAIISNAENTRTNSLRYDVDRASGGIRPDNYDALVGNPQVDLTLFHIIGSTKVGEIDATIPANPSNNQTINTISSPIRQLNREGGARLVVTLADLDNTFGTPVPPVVTINPNFFETDTGSGNVVGTVRPNVIFTIKLYLDVYTGDPALSSLSASPQLLLTQTNDNGTTTTVKNSTPLNQLYISSQTDLYVKLRQTVQIDTLGGTLDSVKIGTFFGELDRYFNLAAVRGVQEPYAQKATIQDSNYTDTGLINARYNGTKTSEGDFSGISPAIAGMEVEVALYPFSGLTTELDKICSSSLADRNIETVLFDGTGTQPIVGEKLVGSIINPDVLTNSVNDNSFRLDIAKGAVVSVGDILVIEQEKVQILNINTATKQPNPLTPGSTDIRTYILYDNYLKLTILRGYDGTIVAAHSDGTQVRRVGGSRLYTTAGSRIKPIGRHLVWLKETNSIISTNDKGFVDSIKTICTVPGSSESST